MAITLVHWHEGMFLQPHHLQVMQRNIGEGVVAERRLALPYPYGLIEARLSPDALENKRVQFERLRAVMPSGLEVIVPQNADLPAIDIKRAYDGSTGSFTVYLGVPQWKENRANTLAGTEDWRVKCMFNVAETARADENTGENAQAVMLRRVNARLMLDSDDPTEMELLPVLRIAHAAGEEVGLPRQDPTFIPPCLLLGGSSVLRELVRDLTQQVEASREELVRQIQRGNVNIENLKGKEFEQLWRLRTLNGYAARLSELVAAPNATPFGMYVELRALLGELAALHLEQDHYDVPAYHHDDMAAGYLELATRIRTLLRGAVAANFITLRFTKEEDCLLARLTDEHFTRPNEYYLGIRTKEDPKTLATLVENQDQFKLTIRSFVKKAIWGIKLKYEGQPPLALPARMGLHYFRLDRQESARLWEQARQEKNLAVRWPNLAQTDYEVTLYMTVPEEKPA